MHKYTCRAARQTCSLSPQRPVRPASTPQSPFPPPPALWRTGCWPAGSSACCTDQTRSSHSYRTCWSRSCELRISDIPLAPPPQAPTPPAPPPTAPRPPRAHFALKEQKPLLMSCQITSSCCISSARPRPLALAALALSADSPVPCLALETKTRRFHRPPRAAGVAGRREAPQTPHSPGRVWRSLVGRRREHTSPFELRERHELGDQSARGDNWRARWPSGSLPAWRRAAGCRRCLCRSRLEKSTRQSWSWSWRGLRGKTRRC